MSSLRAWRLPGEYLNELIQLKTLANQDHSTRTVSDITKAHLSLLQPNGVLAKL